MPHRLGLEAAPLTLRGFTGCPTLFDPASQRTPRPFSRAASTRGGHARLRRTVPNYGARLCDADFPGEALDPLRDHRRADGAAAYPCRPRRSAPCGSLPPMCRRAIGRTRAAASTANSACNTPPPAGLLDGHVGLASFTDERLARPDMQSLLGRSRRRCHATFQASTRPVGYLDLQVTLQDGTIVRTRCAAAARFGAAPITADEHHAKAQDCLATYLCPTPLRRASRDATTSTVSTRKVCAHCCAWPAAAYDTMTLTGRLVPAIKT